jgi:hypothetical protein
MSGRLALRYRQRMPAEKQKSKPGLTELGALRRVDPAEWERRIRAAMDRAGLRIDVAAEMLGISRRQLFRWLNDERLSDVPRLPTGPEPGSARTPSVRRGKTR